MQPTYEQVERIISLLQRIGTEGAGAQRAFCRQVVENVKAAELEERAENEYTRACDDILANLKE